MLRFGPRRDLWAATAVPQWVVNRPNPPDVFLDIIANRAWKKAGGVIVPASSLLTVSRASLKYVNDIGGNWGSVASNALARSGLGALIEESRTNSVRNNSMQGAVVGTPGTLPTNWSVSNANSLTINVVGTGTQNGIDYIDLQFTGTSGTNGAVDMFVEGATQTVASSGQSWTASAFYAFVGGSLTNVGQVGFNLQERDGGGVVVQNNQVTSYTLNSTLTRVNQTAVLGGGTTAFVAPKLELAFSNSSSINVTVRIGWPQLELGASVTSPIRTTASAATRAVDAVTVSTPGAFGGAYTVFAKGTPQSPNGYGLSQNIIQSCDGTDLQRLVLRRQANTAALLTTLVGGTGAAFAPGGTWAANVGGKLASAVAPGDQASVFNGGTPGTASAATLPAAPTAVRLGNNAGGTEQWNGFIEQFAIWYTQRVPNAQLQSMTA